MKRKLDVNDVPSADVAEGDNESQTTFESLSLDPRLRQALVKENFSKPTLVQSKAIPLALEGKDILGNFIFYMLDLCPSLLISKTISAGKDRVWQDGGICSSCSAIHLAEEIRASQPELL